MVMLSTDYNGKMEFVFMAYDLHAQNDSRSLWRKQEASNCQPHPAEFTDSGSQSSLSGNQPERTYRADDSESITLIGRGRSNFTKVLETLQFIKNEHLNYVRAHRQRLQKRLDENLDCENNFLKGCEALENQLHVLIEENQHPRSEE